MRNVLKKVFLLWLICDTYSVSLIAQRIFSEPPSPRQNDDVTIYYDATSGNGELAGYTGDIYAYTGLITSESTNSADWKFVVADWNENPQELKMENVSEDLYSLSFNIEEIYRISSGTQVYALAFVFKNEDGSLAGRREDGGDIFLTINRYSPQEYVSHTFQNGQLLIRADSGSLLIQPYTKNIIEVAYHPDNVIIPDSSFSVTLKPKSIETQLSESAEYLSLRTDGLEVRIQKLPMRVEFLKDGKLLLEENEGFIDRFDDNITMLQFKHGAGDIIRGLGSHAIPSNRNHTSLAIYNRAVYGYSNGTSQLNICVPYWSSDNGYSLFVDNHWRSWIDFGTFDPGLLQYFTEGGKIRYFFMAGESEAERVSNLTELTGRQPMPPIWALGYIQSKFGYQTQEEALNVAEDLYESNFPTDVLILDLYWFGDQTVMGNLDWDKSRFPEPEEMIRELRNKQIKTVLITEPYITTKSNTYGFLNAVGYLGKRTSGVSYLMPEFWGGEAGLLDLTRSSVNDWMWNYYDDLLDEGISGWWCDLGEPELHPDGMLMSYGPANQVHNVYSLMWAKSVFEHQKEYDSKKRMFNLQRSGYVGAQRYGIFPWSGDVSSSFDGLQAQIPIMLGMGLSGFGYMHSDAGGFVGNPGDELYTRWLQMAAFTPIIRAHGVNAPTAPTEYSDEVFQNVRKYVSLRYQLMPYLYTLAYENHKYGWPIVRPMDFHQKGSLAYLSDEVFLFGKDIFVAPVLTDGQHSVEVVLPEGKWVDIETNETYSGLEPFELSVSMEKLPLFARSGTFIPMIQPIRSTDQYDTDTLIVKYYPDPDIPSNTYSLYDDDYHHTQGLEAGSYQLLNFEGIVGMDDLRILLDTIGSYDAMPSSREIYFEIERFRQPPKTVTVNGIELTSLPSESNYLMQENGWYYDNQSDRLHVHISWMGGETEIQITAPTLSKDQISKNNNTLNIFPNPTRDYISIGTMVNIEGEELLIFDQSGRQVKKLKVNGDKFYVGDLHSGLYTVRVVGRKWVDGTFIVM